MVTHVNAEDILKHNPQIDKKELEELLQALSKIRSSKTLEPPRTEKPRSPYFRPSVRREMQKSPLCKTTAHRR